MTSPAAVPHLCALASQEQESSIATVIALVLTGGLYVLAVGILVGGIMGWHTLPFGSPQVARAYYGLELETVFQPDFAQAAPPAPERR